MRKPALRPNMPYHIVNRGSNKMLLFRKPEDYYFFLSKVVQLKRRYKLEIAICCLMPNHFHLLLWHKKSPKQISMFMMALQQSYALKYNGMYKHFGHVFESTYKHKPKSTARSYANAEQYIRQNPVKDGLVKNAENWPYILDCRRYEF